MNRIKGKVLWFNPKLGYGFINNKNIKDDIYVHYSDIKCDGYKELYEDDIVCFIYDEDYNKALNVEVIKMSKKRNQIVRTIIDN